MNLIETLTDLLIGIALVCAVVAFAILVSPQTEVAPRNVGHGTIWEDDVKWDCATMGNRICGPQLLDLTVPNGPNFWQA